MKVSEVVKILNADVLCLTDTVSSTQVISACGADMMSDVLAFVKDQGLLLTGLINPQVVRTAEMMDIPCIAFCRGKIPERAVIQLAEEKGIILLSTKLRLYQACGVLYKAGLDADGEM
ncbi:MAG: DRTGG domain-containing protein [Firmicutes bacterium]|nr:DRTGG domain-containing protein [Bacillota bacterium]